MSFFEKIEDVTIVNMGQNKSVSWWCPKSLTTDSSSNWSVTSQLTSSVCHCSLSYNFIPRYGTTQRVRWSACRSLLLYNVSHCMQLYRLLTNCKPTLMSGWYVSSQRAWIRPISTSQGVKQVICNKNNMARSLNSYSSHDDNWQLFTRVHSAGCEVAVTEGHRDIDDTASATHSAPSLHTASSNHCRYLHDKIRYLQITFLQSFLSRNKTTSPQPSDTAVFCFLSHCQYCQQTV